MWIDIRTVISMQVNSTPIATPSRTHNALTSGVDRIVIPGVERANFVTVRELTHRIEGGAYALGIHPLFTPRATEDNLRVLSEEIEKSLDDPRFMDISEIGLDYFVPALDDACQQL